jgi:hypothetical protein
MTPVTVHVHAQGHGARRVILSCPCVKVGRIVSTWEPIGEVIEQLREDHADRLDPPAGTPGPRRSRRPHDIDIIRPASSPADPCTGRL